MEVRNVLQLPVQEPSQAGDARRQVARWVEVVGLDKECAGRVALVITELAGNLAKHTSAGGELLVRALERGGVLGIEVLSLDTAPGIADVARALSDGFSTAGSPGTGLGAVSRLSDDFAIHSSPGVGTAILARLWAGPAPRPEKEALALGVVSLPKPGQEVCGDGWAADLAPQRSRLMVTDGLGHGPDAAEASREAARLFREHPGDSLTALVERLHAGMRSTRGAALAVADLDPSQHLLRFVGVGNISASILRAGESRSLVSHNGTVGHQLHRVQEFSYPWSDESLLVLHSDGLTTRWDLAAYPGLATRDPALIAGVLYRDFARGRDDATVLVARSVAGR